MRLFRRTIGGLLAVNLAAVVLLSVFAVTAADVVRQKRISERKLEEKGMFLARTLNDVLANPLYFGDVERLRHLSEVMRANPEIEGFTIFDHTGRILVAPTAEKYPSGSVDEHLAHIASRTGVHAERLGDRLRFTKGIEVGGETLGGLSFEFDAAAIDSEVARIVREHVWQGLLITLLGLGLAFWVAQSLVRPIKRLTRASRRIADGELGVAIRTSRTDEIGDLAAAMREMSAALQKIERERARRQNAELSAANEKLVRALYELREAQAERDELIENLQERTAEMEQFIYAVSHDLKSPLVTIRGFLGIAQRHVEAGDEEGFDRDLGIILGATDKMHSLISDLIEVAKVGRLEEQPVAIELTELAHEAVDLVAGRIEARGVEVEIQEDLPVVVADRSRLLDLLQNLVDNAVKFMGDQPAPRIEIGARDSDDEIVFFVRDNGIGIEPALQSRVFDLFVVLDVDAEGTGVGLSLVKRIVEIQGGKIWVESEGLGHGTSFCFTLPTGDPSGAATPAPS